MTSSRKFSSWIRKGVALSAAFTVGVMGIISAPTSWAAPPTPANDEIVVTFQVNGSRQPGGAIAPAIGAKMDLMEQKTKTRLTQDWATCEVTADGCSFVIPVAEAQNIYHLLVVGVNAESAAKWTDVSAKEVKVDITTKPKAGTTYTHPKADRVVLRMTNPTVTPECTAADNLKIALVADLSDSMEGKVLTQLKTAAKSMVDSLTGSYSSMALFTFATKAPAEGTNNQNRSLTSLYDPKDAARVKGWIDGWKADDLTNWDAGLFQVAQSSETFDYVIFITDGNPNKFREASANISNTASANAIKEKGTRIVLVAVGKGFKLERVTEVTGPITGRANAIENDYFQTSWDDLSALLKDLVDDTCPLQYADVVYVDDEANGATVPPKPGTKVQYEGKADQPVGFTEDMARAGVPDNYVYKSVDNVTTFNSDTGHNQTITVHLGHDTEVSEHVVTRTITYTGVLTGDNPADNVHSYPWVASRDKVTGEITYTRTHAGHPAVPTPPIAGHVADIEVVPALAPASPTNVMPMNSTVTVTYSTDGIFSYTNSTFTVSPVVNMSDESTWIVVSAGDKYYTGTLTARDSNNVIITNLTLSDISFKASSNDVTITAIDNVGDGTYVVKYSSKVASATTTATVEYKNQQVGTAKNIPFVAGDPCIIPENCPCEDGKDFSNLSANPTSLPVGQDSTITALVTDEFCNPKKNVEVTFSFDGDGGGGILRSPTGTTGADGKVTTLLTDSVAETVKVKGVISIGALPGSPVSVTFTTGPFSYKESTFEVVPQADLDDEDTWVKASDGDEYYTGILTARDDEKNLLTNLTLTDIVFRANSNTVHITDVINEHDGTYTVMYHSKVASDARKASVTFEGTQVGELLPIPFLAGDDICLDPADCPCEEPGQKPSNLSADPTELQVGETSTITAFVTDMYCNPKKGVDVDFWLTPGSDGDLKPAKATTGADGTATATLTDSTAETVSVHGDVPGGALPGSPVDVTFTPGPFSYEKSTFTVTPIANTADRETWVVVSTGANYYTGTLTAVDQDENPLPNLTLTDIKFAASSTTVRITDVINEGAGIYTVQYSSRVAAGDRTATVTYKNVQVGTAKPIPFKAGDPCLDIDDCDCEDDAIGTNLSVDKTTLKVGELSTATAFIADQFCNPVPNWPVTFAIEDGETGVLNVVQGGITDDNGKAFATVTDTTPEDVVLSAKITAGELKGSPVTITFTPGDVDVLKSSFDVFITDKTASKVVANGTQSWTGQFLAVDGEDNPLPGLTKSDIDFRAPADVTVSAISDRGNGYYEVTYTSTKAAEYTVSLYYQGAQVGANEKIEFVAGDVDPRFSSVTVNPAEQVVGLFVTITVTARDANSNPVKGLTEEDVKVVGAAAGLPDLLLSGFAEASDGVYTYLATSKLVGDFTISATVTGVALTQHPHVLFKHGGVCVTNCEPVDPKNVTRFEMVDNDQLANGTAKDSAKAYAYDTYGNVVPGATVVVIDESTGVLAGILKPPTQTETTGADGTAMVYWTSTKADTFTARGSIDGLYPPATNVMNQIRFSTGEADPAKSEMVITPPSPIVVGHEYTVTVTIRDASGNPVKNQAVALSLTPAKPAELSKDFCTTNDEGVCSETIYSALITTVDVHATVTKNGVPTELGGNGNPAKASPQTVQFIADEVCVVDCKPIDPTHITRVEVDVDGVEANGSASDTAIVYAYDKFGNPVKDAAVNSTRTAADLMIVTPIAPTGTDGTTVIEYRSYVAGAYQAKVSIAGKIPVTATSKDGTVTTDGTITLNFGSGSADPAHSYLTIDPKTPQVVGSNFTVTAHLFDVNDNPVEGAVINFPAVTSLDFAGNATTCTAGADGTCFVTVSSKIVGTYKIVGRIGAVPVSNSVQATFTHGPVCVTDCDPVNKENVTRVQMTTNGKVADGEERNIATVWAYDYYGNAVEDAVVASTPVAGETTLIIQSNIARIGANGTSSIWYSSYVAGPHNANVTVDGKTPNGSPVRMDFSTGPVDLTKSSWVVTPPGPLVVGIGDANTYTATATVKDTAGNAVSGVVVVFSIDPDGPVFDNGSTCTTVNGTCSVKVHSTKSGTYSMDAVVGNGPLRIAGTNETAAVLAWQADEVCSKAEGCDPVDPNLDAKLRTRVEILDNNAVADGIDRDRVIVWAFDKWGNAVEGALVTAVVNPPTTTAQLNIQPGIDPIGKDGSSIIWFTSTVAGDHSTMIRTNGLRPVGSPITLNFVPGPVCVVEAGCVPEGPGKDPKNQTRVEVTKDNQPVDKDPNQVTAYAFDKWGNKVPNVVFTFSKSDPNDDLVLDASCTTAANGQCVANAKATKSGAHQGKAFVGPTELVDHGSPFTLNFEPGDVCIVEDGCEVEGPGEDPANQTRVEITKNNQPTVTGTDEFKVLAFDKYGNEVVKGVVFDVRTSDTGLFIGEHRFRSNVQLLTNDLGIDESTAFSDVAGSHAARVYVNNVELSQHGSPMDLRFLAPPVITSPKDGDSTNQDPVVIEGTGTTPGNTITVKDEDGKTVCTATIQANGTWSCEANLDDGEHTIIAVETTPDGKGTSDPSDPITFEVDTVAPGKPVIDYPSDGDIINDTKPPIGGKGDEPGNTITVTDQDNNVICDTKVKNDKTWECTPKNPLDDGDYELVAVETDKAGNDSAPSDPVVITVDTQDPSDPIVDKSNGSQFTGKTDPDTTVTFYDKDGKPVDGCVNVKPTGVDFICYPTTPVKAEDNVVAIAKDPAGNTSNPVPVVITPISAKVAYPTVNPGGEQVVTGYNFNPGENVCLVMTSDPVDLGCRTANDEGEVTFTFTIPAGKAAVGMHTVTLTGARSGSASDTFIVPDVAGPDPEPVPIPKPVIKTGGNSIGSYGSALWGFAIASLMVGFGVLQLRRSSRVYSEEA
ncbi:MAG: Ig-like domain-containing protein [Propionibacteriaceae bacterium]|nr:Ig-like domain-containing protein [Propionibacteriaceae bacterium]